jgi:hypothetical protein
MEADLVRCNPTLGVRKIKYPIVGHHRWTPDEIEQFKATPSRTSTGRRSAPTIHASGRPLRFEMAITPADFQRLRHLLPGADQARLEAMSACGEEPGGGRWHATCSPPSARHHWPNDDDTSPNVASTFIRNPPCRDVDWPAMLSAATSAWSAASGWIALTKCAPVEKSSASGGTTKRRRPTLIQATSKF